MVTWELTNLLKKTAALKCISRWIHMEFLPTIIVRLVCCMFGVHYEKQRTISFILTHPRRAVKCLSEVLEPVSSKAWTSPLDPRLFL